MAGRVSSAWYSRPAPVSHPVARLICLPHAGRSGSMYRPWIPLIPDGIELCWINPPGREARFDEPLATSMSDLAGNLVTGLRPLLDGVPVVIFGHSLGALVGYELCRRLGADGPAHLVVSACPPPHLASPAPPMTGLSDHEVIERLRELGGTPEELLTNPAAMELLLPVIRADYLVAEHYQQDLARTGPTAIRAPITVLSAPDDPETAGADLRRWADTTTAPCDWREFGGGHFFLETARPMVLAAVAALLVAQRAG